MIKNFTWSDFALLKNETIWNVFHKSLNIWHCKLWPNIEILDIITITIITSLLQNIFFLFLRTEERSG